MTVHISTTFSIPVLVVCWASTATTIVSAESAPLTAEFARDIRPVLVENCFQCHGPDEGHREADLRLDLREGIFGDEDRAGVVVRHQPEESELFARITADDVDGRMPPPEHRERLKPHQIRLIRLWIEQGARWQPHWAFVRPTRAGLPQVRNAAWARNGIDYFVLSRLEKEGLSPAPEADKEILIRRVSLDLTGLPPTPAEVDAFLADDAADAYERLVERLLSSPRYGERMAATWLDAARYADTYGYQDDGEVSMWRWRDWVIDALNSNMPFDQFTIEQLAGDLLPKPTLEQRLATGFNRNHRANSEGGAIPEEFRTEYVVDRVDTTATVWLGLTMICARCHDHKYDTISQREFYQFFAFFNNVPEDGRARKTGNTPPMMPAPTRQQRRRQDDLEVKLKAARETLIQLEPEIDHLQSEWERSAVRDPSDDLTVTRALEAHFPFDGDVTDLSCNAQEVSLVNGDANFCDGKIGEALALDGNFHVSAGDVASYSDDDKFTLAAWVWPEEGCDGSILSRTKDGPKPEGYDLVVRNRHVRIHLNAQWIDDSIRLEAINPLPTDRWTHVAATVDGSLVAGGVRVYFNGVQQDVHVEIDSLYQSFGNDGPLRIGASGDPASRFRGRIDDARAYADNLSASEVELIATPATVYEILTRPVEERTAAERRKLRAFFLQRHAPKRIAAARKLVVDLERELKELIDAFPSVMIMEDSKERRPTHVLVRGQYDQPSEVVSAGVPSILPPLPATAPANRLSLANWLVDPQHPLTARVMINRLWQMSFGTGLVKTAEDFGVQGEPPSHPMLLDWLAREFVDGGWDVKAIRRLIVTSATYRQSSQATTELWAVDPENRLLARGPRFRMPAEMIRDFALSAGGLLVEKVGGLSVRPYQPPRLWEDLSNDQYEQDHGEELYRRSLYVFWKRTVPYPTMALFDASSRETCLVREERTNTPLQALTLMNETGLVEASRALAERAVREASPSPAERLAYAFRIVTGRQPNDAEQRILLDSFQRHVEDFQRQPEAAAEFISVGEKQRDKSINPVELAAYAAVCNLLLNLDEAITQH